LFGALIFSKERGVGERVGEDEEIKSEDGKRERAVHMKVMGPFWC